VLFGMRRKRRQRRVDTGRVRFQRAFIEAMNRAACDGVDVRGYLDRGCGNRSCPTYVDYSSLRRLPKSSFRCYADLINRARRQ